MGLIAVSDPAKETMPEAMATLRDVGMTVVMATGDGVTTAKAVAAKLGISDVYGEVEPLDNLTLVKQLQQPGKVVAMAGDGINDAPALAKADPGIAMEPILTSRLNQLTLRSSKATCVRLRDRDFFHWRLCAI
ncbi:hypothetical protein MasN3_26700 [Massilia varians]|uniref:Uncharacterized protein n=1 Tax=Massilia varians TaxID=457921 RepID=A0ABN6TBX2_9BURK|nr:hypothetical protein MasN3_26700 [Massilia varians]